MDQIEHNLQQQTELYGEPLGELMRRIGGALGLTQARLAETIGLSAPMLSQLMSAQRVKIGNPAVVPALHSLDELVGASGRPEGLEPAEIAAALDQIRGSHRRLHQIGAAGNAPRRPRRAGGGTGDPGPVPVGRLRRTRCSGRRT